MLIDYWPPLSTWSFLMKYNFEAEHILTEILLTTFKKATSGRIFGKKRESQLLITATQHYMILFGH